jgi:starch-binding outer membrane protein, SusD/RagB family
MKKLNYKVIIPAGVLLLGTLYACKKSFLDRPPLGTLNQDILATNAGVQGLLIGAYSGVDGDGGKNSGLGSGGSNWTYGEMGADDSYKGSDPSDGGADAFPIETKTVTSTNAYVASKWDAYYDYIQRCNDVLRVLPKATDITPDAAKEIQAEARFLRAHFHFDLKKIFGNIPFIDENVTVSSGSDVGNWTGSAYKDIWPNIEADFQFAVDNLPETQPQVGRANKWAAMAYLAKAYLFEHKYAQAKALFDQVIANGKTSGGKKYALLPNYFSNFNPAQKNSEESVFAAQESVQDNSSTAWAGANANGNYGDLLNFPYNGGPGQCCGWDNPSQDLGNFFKTDDNGYPLFDTYFEGQTTDATTPYAGPLDPRIDWTIGRPGIPYLDWGVHPGDAWIRNVGADGHFTPKKNVYAASQKDQYTDAGSGFWAPTELTANNVNIIRYADVLLMAAECEVEVGDLSKALDYVNQVRARAANKNGWVYANSDYDATKAEYKDKTTPAANYNIALYTAAQFSDKAFARKAVRTERRLELAMEGHRFFDLQRWDGRFGGTEPAGYMASVLNAMYQRDGELVSYKKSTNFVAGKHELYPIPQTQIDLENADGKVHLKQNPGY